MLLPVAFHSGKHYMLTSGSSMYTIDGTPYAQPADAVQWQVVGYVDCLYAWQLGEMLPARHFRYVGPDTHTRGEYGVVLKGGHNTVDDPSVIVVFDPDMGNICWGSIERGLECKDWEEIPPEEWMAL